MKVVFALATALAFGMVGLSGGAALAQGGGKSTMETGSNATDTKGAGMSKMSGGAMKPKSKMKGKK